MNIAIAQGDELDNLIYCLRFIVQAFDLGQVHTLRFATEGGLKLKSNGGMWTASMGRMADENGY